MAGKSILLKFMDEIVIELNVLSESDIQKLESGDYSLSLKVLKSKKKCVRNLAITEDFKEEILNKFKECSTREDGFVVLSQYMNDKKTLTEFARMLDISVLKQDSVDKIKEKIIESTVGAVIRSNAIQGKIS